VVPAAIATIGAIADPAAIVRIAGIAVPVAIATIEVTADQVAIVKIADPIELAEERASVMALDSDHVNRWRAVLVVAHDRHPALSHAATVIQAATRVADQNKR
jgi:hypothetical protein